MLPISSLSHVPQLLALLISNNRLSIVPDKAFSKLSKLQHIDLSENTGLSLSSASFTGVENVLRNVSLNKVGLTEFPVEQLKLLSRLTLLKLDGNSIRKLQGNLFQDFTTTTKRFQLSLRNNRINFIHQQAFSDNGRMRIENLNLQGNRLTGLDFLSEPCTLLFTLDAYVNVKDNSIHCDCDVYSAIQAEYVHVYGKCSSPQQYSGFWLDPVIDDTFQQEGNIECQDVTNYTGIVICDRDNVDAAHGLNNSYHPIINVLSIIIFISSIYL